MVIIDHKNKTLHLVKNDDNISVIRVNGYLGRSPLFLKERNKFRILDLIEEEMEIAAFKNYLSIYEEIEVVSTNLMMIKLQNGLFKDYDYKYSNFDYAKNYSYEGFMICLKSNQEFMKKIKPSRKDIENTFLFLNS